MRLWHKALIPVLPRQQLLGQWRELCLIAKNLAVRGTPNHILVNRITELPKWHLMSYALLVAIECECRGYKIDRYRFFKWFDQWHDGTIKTGDVPYEDIYFTWHNDRYLLQCYYNLQEKYDCGAISKADWLKIEDCVEKELAYEP